MLRAQELCRKLRPVLGAKVDRLWAAYLAESDATGKSDIEQTLELLAAKHLGQDYQPDRSPFPPPLKTFAASGDVRAGSVAYAHRELYPFLLKSARLREHLLIAGRSGSGKTNLTFVLMRGIMARGIKVLALDWKRGYRDLLGVRPDLRVYTIGRDVAPLRFNPLIPPAGCEPGVWIKLIVDVIAAAYLGGEGVISLLVAGIDKLYRDAGVYDRMVIQWPTIPDLLAWLRKAKLKGRAAMWQASAERILLAMTYGEFGRVVDTQNNGQVLGLLEANCVLEMDGLSSNSDRKLFSEALTLYLYRYRLAQGPRAELTNLIVLEEAHNLLLRKATEARESVLESSIRMIRQYGLGYVFVDQSASLLSQVAFANSYATIALSQKLRGDVQAIAGAMNLTDEQKQALTTLPVGTAVVRLADEHPEAFLIRVPRFPIREGSVTDAQIRAQRGADSGHSDGDNALRNERAAVPAIPAPDKNKQDDSDDQDTHPPSPGKAPTKAQESRSTGHPDPPGKIPQMSREAVRFLSDLAARPLSTTVHRYQRLHLSRRRGNAVRQSLQSAGLIEPVPIATRSGQVMLYQLTELGRSACASVGIDPGARCRESLEHRYWVRRAAEDFAARGYEVTREHPVEGNGAIDLLAVRPGERVAVEIETGKSDVPTNLAKVRHTGFDRVVLVATNPQAVTTCQRAIDAAERGSGPRVEQLSWLDVS